MRLSDMALFASLALGGCESGSVKLDDTAGQSEEGCNVLAYFDAACPTDACPAIEHADPLVGLRTAVFATVSNVGGAT